LQRVEQIVRRWYAVEGSKDMPYIPADWSDACWSCLVDLFPHLRTWVAHQPYAPEGVIRHLATVDDWEVRYRVAEKRNLPRDLFVALAADPAPLVRVALARNAKAPLELVEELSSDPQPDVARAACFQLERRRDALAEKTKRHQQRPGA